MTPTKASILVVAVLLIVILQVPTAMPARHLPSRKNLAQTQYKDHIFKQTQMVKVDLFGAHYWKKCQFFGYADNSPKRVRGETVEVAGSRLPDCSHACGSCAPCRLVMVRYFCSSVEDSETCPLAYKCMCSHKSFPVPWLYQICSYLWAVCIIYNNAFSLYHSFILGSVLGCLLVIISHLVRVLLVLEMHVFLVTYVTSIYLYI